VVAAELVEDRGVQVVEMDSARVRLCSSRLLRTNIPPGPQDCPSAENVTGSSEHALKDASQCCRGRSAIARAVLRESQRFTTSLITRNVSFSFCWASSRT